MTRGGKRNGAGRPKLVGAAKPINVRLWEPQLRAVGAIAREEGISRAECLRRLVGEAIAARSECNCLIPECPCCAEKCPSCSVQQRRIAARSAGERR